MEKTRNPVAWHYLLAALVIIAKITVYYFFVNRSIEPGDEGQILSGYRYPFEYYTFPYYQFIVSLLGNLQADVIVARMLRMVVELVSIILISISIFLWATSNNLLRREYKSLFSIILFSALPSTSFVFGRVLIYDDFTFLFAALSLLLLSYAWFRMALKEYFVHASYILSGVLLGFLVFIKPSVPIVLFVSYFLLTYSFFYARTLFVWKNIACLVTGILLGLAFGVGIVGLDAITKDLQEIAAISPITDYNIFSLLHTYIVRDTKFLLLLLSIYIVSTIIARNRIGNFSLLYIGLTILAGAGVVFYTSTMPMPIKLLHVSMWLITSSSVSIAAVYISSKAKFSTKTFVVFLLFLPFLVALGTNNSIFENASVLYPVLFGTSLLLAQQKVQTYFKVILVSFSLFAVFHFGITQVIYPYGIVSDFFSQNEQRLDCDTRIIADEKTASFFNDLYSLLTINGYLLGDEIIVTDGLTGVATTLGGKMPQTLYLIDNNPEYNCHHLKKLAIRNKQPFFIRFSKGDTRLNMCLSESVLNFPNAYKLVATLHNPFKETYNVHYGGNLADSVWVYAPDSFFKSDESK